MIRCAAVVFAVLMVAGVASAQSRSDVSIPQTGAAGSGAADATSVAQVGSRAAPLPAPAPPPRDRAVTGSARPAPAPAPATQVTGERGQAYSRLDLPAVEASAEAPASPAHRAEGRNTATVVPTGPDRCDPQADRRSAACANVIETRAADYPAPSPEPLSPEQRLLATQNAQAAAPNSLDAAARRLANGQVDGSNAALAVASMALNPPARPEEEEAAAPELDAGTLAIVSGIVGAIVGPASPPN